MNRFETAQQQIKMALNAECEYNALVKQSLAEHGSHGPLVSGIVRDHFPVDVKARLRQLNATRNAEQDKGLAARPWGVHKRTMLKMWREMWNAQFA